MEENKDNDNVRFKISLKIQSTIVEALLNTLNDNNHDVRQSVIESLEKISKKDPNAVIVSVLHFVGDLEMHKKRYTEDFMGSVLCVMSSICKHSTGSLSTDSLIVLTQLAVNELTGKTENEACDLLLEICKINFAEAMNGLSSKVELGVIPQPAIVSTMGKLAAAINPNEILSFINHPLCCVLQMLSHIWDEHLKQSICFMIEKFCEAINDYITNTKDPSLEISKQLVKEEIRSAFDVLAYTWLKTSRDFKSTDAIFTTLVPMISLLPEEDNDRIAKLVPVSLNVCKKQGIRLAAVRVLASVLLHCTQTESKESIRPFIDVIHQTVSEIVSTDPFEATRDTLLTHYKVLQCIRSLVILYPKEGLDRILRQLKSSNVNDKARALVILKYLINTLPEDAETLQRIARSLQESLGEKCPLQTVGAIAALIARPTFTLLPPQRTKFVRYMVSHCDMEACDEALYLLATTVDRVESWMWPCLVEALLDPTYTKCATSVLRSLSSLATKIVVDEETSVNRDFPGPKVLARCLELLDDPDKRLVVLTFLISAASLIEQRVKCYWEKELSELVQQISHDAEESTKDENNSSQRNLDWEEQIVKLLEENVKLEGESWGDRLADELALKPWKTVPSVALYLASVCTKTEHIGLLVAFARDNDTISKQYARAVGICAKRHPNIVLKLLNEFCATEDARKAPGKVLGFFKDTKATTVETTKAGLLRCYGEIARRGDPDQLFPMLEKHVLPWTIKQITECKEMSTKETGLLALEQIASALRSIRFPESEGLSIKSSALDTLMGMLQSPSGYRPLQLYPAILKATNSLICIPPALTSEEREVFLNTILNKTIDAISEISLQSPELIRNIFEHLGTLFNEVISKSSYGLPELIDILTPRMRSNSNAERQITLLVLHAALRSYCNNLDSTYSACGTLFCSGKLVGRILCWCADREINPRYLAVDCLPLCMEIAYRFHNISFDDNLKKDLQEIKETVMGFAVVTTATDDSPDCYVEKLTRVVARKIPSAETFNFAKELIEEGLLFCKEACMVASIALEQHFEINGPRISSSEVWLVDDILMQMGKIGSTSCKEVLAKAIASLTAHHTSLVIKILLSQPSPLPLNPDIALCWKTIGSHSCAPYVLDSLLTDLETYNLFDEDDATSSTEGNDTACLSPLAIIMAVKYLLDMSWKASLVDMSLGKLVPVLVKYFTGWLRANQSPSMMRIGYAENRTAHKIDPHAEVYSVLVFVLNVVHAEYAAELPAVTAFTSETHAVENVILTMKILIKCISGEEKVLSHLARSLKTLMTATLAVQRAVAIMIYAEIIGMIDREEIGIDEIIDILFEAKADSSSLVRKYAAIALARITYLGGKIYEHDFTRYMDALLEALEEPADGESDPEVTLESLRGLTALLSAQYVKPVRLRVLLATKPLVEKENREIKLTAIEALGSLLVNWQRSALAPTKDLIVDYLLGYLPSLIIKLEDSDISVVKAAQDILCKATFYYAVLSKKLSLVINTHLGPEAKLNFLSFSKDLIDCLKDELPERAEDFRNAVVRDYSRSENPNIRATSALLLGLFASLKPGDVQRLLELLLDTESIVKIRASQALSLLLNSSE